MTFKMTAERYARALYEVADEAGELDSVKGDMHTINNIFDKLPEVRDYCLGATVSASNALTLIALTFSEFLKSLKTKNTLEAMAENTRLSSLSFLADAFSAICARKENRITAVVEFAHSPEKNVLTEITQRMTDRIGKKVDLTVKINPSLLGGFIIRWSDRIIDNSALGRIRRLRQL